jgi:CBS domain containing-hemolysin-like protein
MTIFVLIFITVLLSAFFSGLEIAFLSANKLRIELSNAQGKKWAFYVSEFIKSPSKFLSTILVGNNLALVIYGILMEEALSKKFTFPFKIIDDNFTSLIFITLISTAIIVLIAEFLPKALFKISPSAILSVLIYPFKLAYIILWPLTSLVIRFSEWVLRKIFKSDDFEQKPIFSKVDLDHFVELGLDNTTKDEETDVATEIFKNALDFSSIQVRDCVVPRTELVSVSLDSSINELEELFQSSRHSKILVFKDSIDNVIGYVHHLDLFKHPESIKSILHSIPVTSETKSAQLMLEEFSQLKKSIALVVDEYGGTAGIITVEDIMEEVLGEIDDEHDETDSTVEVVIDKNHYQFSAQLEIDYLNEKYELNLPDGDYETLGGFIVSELEDIPQEGDEFNIKNFYIKVIKASDRKIETVELKME